MMNIIGNEMNFSLKTHIRPIITESSGNTMRHNIPIFSNIRLKKRDLFIIFFLFYNIIAFAQSNYEIKIIVSDTLFYSDSSYRVIDKNNYYLLKESRKRDSKKRYYAIRDFENYKSIDLDTINYDTINSNFKVIEIEEHPYNYKALHTKFIKFNSYIITLEKEYSDNKNYYLILFNYTTENNPVLEVGKVYNLTLQTVFNEDFSNAIFYSFSSDYIIKNYLVCSFSLQYMNLHTLVQSNGER